MGNINTSTTVVKEKVYKQNRGPKRKKQVLPITFILPSFIMIFMINLYPTLSGFVYSVRNGNLIQQGSFVGLHNFTEVLKMQDFWNALQFSLIFSVVSVVGSYLFGLILALMLNQDFFGRGFFRVALLVPWIIPSIVSIVSWRWLIGDQTSLVNEVLGWFHIQPILFLADKTWAIVSVSIIKIWRSFPFMMLSLLAALQSADDSQYEAAEIDGATSWQKFFYITLPHIKGVTVICWILMTIWSVNDFDTIYLLTQGGPDYGTENLIILAYRMTFGTNNVGYGAAIAIITLIILMVIAFVFLKQQKNTETAED